MGFKIVCKNIVGTRSTYNSIMPIIPIERNDYETIGKL